MSKQAILIDLAKQDLQSPNWDNMFCAGIMNPEVMNYVVTCKSIWKDSGVSIHSEVFRTHLKGAIERGYKMYGGSDD